MRELLYPKVKEAKSIDYRWEGYSDVIVFSTDDSIKDLADWYFNQFESFDELLFEDSDLSLNLYSGGLQIARIMAVAVEAEDSLEDLVSFITPRFFQSMLRDSPRTIGALFIVQRNE